MFLHEERYAKKPTKQKEKLRWAKTHYNSKRQEIAPPVGWRAACSSIETTSFLSHYRLFFYCEKLPASDPPRDRRPLAGAPGSAPAHEPPPARSRHPHRALARLHSDHLLPKRVWPHESGQANVRNRPVIGRFPPSPLRPLIPGDIRPAPALLGAGSGLARSGETWIFS